MTERCVYGYNANGCELGYPGCMCADDVNEAHTGSCAIYDGMDDETEYHYKPCDCGGDERLAKLHKV